MSEGCRNGVMIPEDACLRQDEGMQERYFIQAPLLWYEQAHKRRALALMGAVAAPVVMQCRSWYRNSQRFRICLQSTESPFTFRSSSNQTFIQGSPERLPFLFEGRQGTVQIKVAHNATKDVLLVDINDRPMYGFNIRTANRGLSPSRTGAEPRA